MQPPLDLASSCVLYNAPVSRRFWKTVLSSASDSATPTIDIGADCVWNIQILSKIEQHLHVNMDEGELRGPLYRHLYVCERHVERKRVWVGVPNGISPTKYYCT